MRGITIRNFKASDLQSVDPDNPLVCRENLESYQSIFTVEHNGTPVVCAGLIPLWPGVAEAWTAPSGWAKEHPLWLVRLLKRFLPQEAKRLNLHRVQMHLKDDPARLKWGRTLGFQHEGTFQKFTSEGHTLHLLAYLP